MLRFLRPSTLAEASALALQHDDEAKIVSGGTAVVLMLQQGLIAPTVLVSLRDVADVADWHRITLGPAGLRIGGGVTLAAVARSGLVREHAPALATAAGSVGNVRVRNVATLCGNVAEADYASDPPAVLVALGATVEAGDGRSVRSIAAADVFTDFYSTDLMTGEIVTAVHVPLADGAVSSYTKYCSRSAEDRPCVGVATSLRVRDDAVAELEVVLGAVGATPRRWSQVTTGVVGRPLDGRLAAEVASAYADAVDPIEDARGSAWYRREMVRVLVRRSIEDLCGRGGA